MNDETLTICTMTITEANSLIGANHDRMPVLLDHEGTKAWLSGKGGIGLLRPAPDDGLRMWPVSRPVNKPGDDPSLIDPVTVHSAAEPATLFRLNQTTQPRSPITTRKFIGELFVACGEGWRCNRI